MKVAPRLWVVLSLVYALANVASRLLRYGVILPAYYGLKVLLFGVLVGGHIFTWLWVWVPVALAGLVAILYFFIILAAFPSQTPAMLNFGFGTLAVLATLSFACCRAVEDETRKHFLLAGQRFFRAALLFLLASVLQYALINLPGTLTTLFPQTDWTLLSRLTFPYKGTGQQIYTASLGILFLMALTSAVKGVAILNRVLHADHVFAKLKPTHQAAKWKQLAKRWMAELERQWRSL